MGQLKQILEGYYYLLCTEDAEVESMAKERQEKCDGCVHAITIKGKWFLRRRKARELALKMLYQMEVNLDAVDGAFARNLKVFPHQDDIVDYTRLLLSGVKREQGTLDRYIEEASEKPQILFGG